jgi:hypothetical protein
MRRLSAVLVVAVLVGCAAGTSVDVSGDKIFALTDAYFRDGVKVGDDPLDLDAEFMTPSIIERRTAGFWRMDAALRGFISKKTGAMRFQAYQMFRYYGDDWDYFNAATIATPTGPEAVQVYPLSHYRDCEDREQGVRLCLFSQDFAFDIDESVLRRLASAYGAPDAPESALHYRLRSQGGDAYNGIIPPAEAKGLLDAMDRYKATHPR